MALHAWKPFGKTSAALQPPSLAFEGLKRSSFAFTLAELLIALAILGVIATFTIPKILQTQQDNRFKALGKEAAATISGAFQAYQQQNQLNSGLKPGDLTPYMNYVSLDSVTVGRMDDIQTNGTLDCTNGQPCWGWHYPFNEPDVRGDGQHQRHSLLFRSGRQGDQRWGY